jgi:hypothetical protein
MDWKFHAFFTNLHQKLRDAFKLFWMLHMQLSKPFVQCEGTPGNSYTYQLFFKKKLSPLTGTWPGPKKN